MRLNKYVLNKIKNAVKNSFGDVNIYLFGSRLDNSKKGGDIDIAIETDLSRLDFRKKKVQFISNLLKNDFDYKIDLVDYNTTDSLLYELIRKKSIKI
jgi:predicted nucleotidyltransferase